MTTEPHAGFYTTSRDVTRNHPHVVTWAGGRE